MVCPVGCLSLASSFGKCKEKTGTHVFHFGVGSHASFPQKPVVNYYNFMLLATVLQIHNITVKKYLLGIKSASKKFKWFISFDDF